MFNLSNFQKWKDCRVLKFYETADSLQEFSYGDLYGDSIRLASCIENVLSATANIGILLSIHSPALLPVIVGIENSGCVSCFIDSSASIQTVRQRMIDFKTDVALCDLANLSKLETNENSIKIIVNITLFNENCALVKIENLARYKDFISISDDNDDKLNTSKVLFYATTSGSCGDVKPIGVTYKCFHPNITSLGNLYKVVQQDVFFVSSPPTFDPFMIDICLALNYGASLIITNNTLRCDAAKLFQILFPIDQSEVTIMATTPSLFTRWSSSEKLSQIFSSKLRILAFGGESFPSTKVMSKWTNWKDNATRIFNLYGLTEMSCWACVYEISKSDILLNRKIPIGRPLDEHTSLELNEDKELILKSKVRKCFQSQLSNEQVINNDYELVLRTEDLMEVDDESQLYFAARLNSIVKFYGRKINLVEIEAYAKTVDGVKDVVCIHDEKLNSIYLFAKVNDNLDSNIKSQILESVQTCDVRLKICCIPEFPLTAHGKICKSTLIKTVPITSKPIQLEEILNEFQDILNESLAAKIDFTGIESRSSETQKMAKQDIDSSFIHLGGSSLKAIQIVDEFERITLKAIPQLLPMLLDDRISIREIISVLNDKVDPTENHFNETNSINQNASMIVPRWQIDMKKCIDATATVCVLKDGLTIVSIGSHSKLLYNISVETGEVISKLELPDRIESQVLHILDNLGIVGCYDGFLYCFNIRNGAIKWKFNSGAMIKCRALFIGSMIIFGNYNESKNLWCVEAKNGNTIWSQRIGNKSIYANPIPIGIDDENCIACTLDGTVASTSSTTGQILWTFDAKAPIFATPSVFKNSRQEIQIILAAVDGKTYLLNSDGVSTWTHQIDGNIFSTVECFSMENSTNFVFGSQDHFLYRFKMESNFSCTEIWKYKTSASIRSSPIYIKKNSNCYVIIFSSDGMVRVINCINGDLVKEMEINGQIFSTPVMHDQSLFVGSRNNFFYCINLADLI